MHVKLVDGRIRTTPAMTEYVRTKLSAALDRFAGRIGEVEVHLKDENGPRGGSDKRCRIVAHVNGAGVLHVEDLEAEYYPAIDRAAAKLKRAASRFFERRRDR